MDFSKIKKISFILLILFILLFPFWCVRGLCAEIENVDFLTVSGIHIRPTENFFNTAGATGEGVGYFQLEKGYKYTITNNHTFNRYLAISNSVPVLNGTYTFLTTLEPGQSYIYLSDNSNNDYLYFDFSSFQNVSVTKEKVVGQQSAVNDLVSNVGVGQIWDIFDISINYIVVVLLFAFGSYIIFRIIKKVSRGKEGL